MESKVVVAVGSASGTQGRNPFLSQRIEAAMSQAVLDAIAEGIPMTDTDTIRARQLAARASVMAEHHKTAR